MKTKEHSLAIRDLVIQQWEDKESGRISERKIAASLKIPKSTVHDIIFKYKKTKSIENIKGRGRKPLFNHRQRKSIIRKCVATPRLSAPKLAAEVKYEMGISTSDQTIRNILHQSGLKSAYAKKKPFISKANQKKRLDFARRHINKDSEFWNSIIWSDESRFRVFGCDGRIKVWRKSGESLKMKNLNPTVKHGGGGIMVWGCMAYKGVGNLEIIDGIMNQFYYQNILTRNLKESAKKLGLGRRYTFQQDNDPKHKSKSTLEYLAKNKINVLDWPPQSPDLNPIEHLWDNIDRQLRTFHISNKIQLEGRIKEVWGRLHPDITKTLVNSMQRRLLAVISARGGPTTY